MLTPADIALLKRCPFVQLFYGVMAQHLKADRDRATRLCREGFVRLEPRSRVLACVRLTDAGRAALDREERS